MKETWIDLLHPDDRIEAVRKFTQYLEDGSPGIYENYFRMRHADGCWVWIYSRGITLRDKNEVLTDKTIGTHINITDSKMTEEAVRITSRLMKYSLICLQMDILSLRQGM